MPLKYTNVHGITLPLAVFLMFDKYDYDDRPNVISATTLIRPLRQLILTQRNKALDKAVDISDLIGSRMGSAIHDGCEEAWSDLTNVSKALKVMGASDDAISKIKINPTEVAEGDIPVYIENRAETLIDGFIISGKYDLVLDGTLNDYKSGSVWGYIFDSNSDKNGKQGSIYKWLNPDKITSDYINIQHIFTDWSAASARRDSTYPQLKVITEAVPIWEPAETEAWIRNKLGQFTALMDAPQEMLPECDDDELWASKTVHKYYKNPKAMTRATKNFDDLNEAISRKANDGDVGVIVTVPGEVKACRYCPAVAICQQAEKMLASGRLVL